MSERVWGPFDPNLDYTALGMPNVLIQSLRRRHFMVFMTSMVTLILKAEVLLAASLFSVSPTQVTEPVTVQLLTSFNSTYESPLLITEKAQNAYFAAQAVHGLSINPPFGVTEDHAYQTFVVSGTKCRGTSQQRLKVTVDGVFSNTKCIPLESYSVNGTPFVYHSDDETTAVGMLDKLDIDLRFENCNETIPLNKGQRITYTLGNGTGMHVVSTTFSPNPRPCSNLVTQGNRFLWFQSYWRPKGDGYSSDEVVESVASVLCSENTWLSKLEVIDDGNFPTVIPLFDEHAIPIDSNVWEILLSSIPDANGKVWDPFEPAPRSIHEVFGPLAVDLIRGNESSAGITNELIHNCVLRLAGKLRPLLAHFVLRQSDESNILGERLISVHELFVSQKVCLSMSALFIALAVAMGGFNIWHGRYIKVLSRDPATVLGLLLHSQARSYSATKLSDSDLDAKKNEWVEVVFSPLLLKTWAQSVFTISLCCLIIFLVFTLQLSESRDGILNVPQQGYWHLTWTTLPALAMFVVASYVSSCSTSWRDLSSLSHLAISPLSFKDVDISFVDMIGVRTVLVAYRRKAWTVLIQQITTFSCGFLTTLASVAFSDKLSLKPVKVQLQQNSWFGEKRFKPEDEKQFIIMLVTNRHRLSTLFGLREEMDLTFPKSTFGDLLFPTINGDNITTDDILETNRNRNLAMQATIPAAKVISACTRLPPSNDIFLDVMSDNDIHEVRVKIPAICPNGTNINITYEFPFDRPRHKAQKFHFAAMMSSFNYLVKRNWDCGVEDYLLADLLGPSLTQYYVWGQWSQKSMTFDFLRIYSCNYSWVQISVNTSLIWSDGELLIEKASPPKANNASMRPWSPAFVAPELVLRVENRVAMSIFPAYLNKSFGEDGYMDAIFKRMIKPYGKLPVDIFHDPGMNRIILEELNKNVAIGSAQIANLENRLSIGEDSRSTSFPPGGLPLIDAIVTDHSRRRLFQNPTVTYIVLGIPGFSCLVHLWILVVKAARHFGIRSKILMDVGGLAPEGFNSPALMEALLHDSNAAKFIPKGAQKLPPAELHKKMEGVRFRMGWYMKESDETMHYTIGVPDDEDFTFMGSKAEMAAAERHRAKAD